MTNRENRHWIPVRSERVWAWTALALAAAIIALALIVLHAIGAVLYGLELNFENVSGLLALLVLLPVPISGLFRYRRLDKKWHLRTGLAFAILFLLHAFL